MTPADPHHKIRIKIPHKTTCLPAPPLFSDLQWWLERSEQGETEDMTCVGTEDMSSVAEGRVLLENQITKNHSEEIREEESWMRNLIRGNTEEESEKHLGGIWEASGGIWEASGRHLGGWRHLEALRIRRSILYH